MERSAMGMIRSGSSMPMKERLRRLKTWRPSSHGWTKLYDYRKTIPARLQERNLHGFPVPYGLKTTFHIKWDRPDQPVRCSNPDNMIRSMGSRMVSEGEGINELIHIGEANGLKL